jgi:hypothetical protein
LRQYEQNSNLFTLLALGQKPLLPSLLPEQIARPWAQGVFDLDRWWLLLPCIAGLALAGLLMLALPLAALGQVVREEPFSPLGVLRQTPRIWLRMLGLLAVIIAGIVGIFIQSTMFHLLLSVATAVLFSGFVMYDFQRLRNAEGVMTDAIWLAVSIYLDIFNLFLAILRIFGIFGSSDD